MAELWLIGGAPSSAEIGDEAGGSLRRPLPGKISTFTDSRLYLKSRGEIDAREERDWGD